MTKLSTPLKLFAYTGREQGLMVVGSREAMAELSSQIASALDAQPAVALSEWPPELVSAAAQVGPYIGSQHWRVSFHIEGSIPSEQKALVVRSSPRRWISLTTFALAVVGVIAVLRMAWNAL